MKVSEHIAVANKTLFSFEVLPPMKGKSIDSLYAHLDPLMEFKPSFINVTYHRSEQTFKKRADGSFDKIDIRKRPGTVGICAAIMNHYRVDAVPHLICGGFSKDETENALIDLNFLGIDNVLALRGDAPKNEKVFVPHPQGHRYAIDLVKQITDLNDGKYIEDDILDGVKTDFSVGIAGYPEKHFEAPNLEVDIMYTKEKIEAGADYITTQMFFNNAKYFEYLQELNQQNIQVPVIAGLKPISTKKQLSILPSIFHVDLPTDLSMEIMKCKTDAAVEIVGEDWLVMQCKELMAKNAPVIHFYTLGKPHIVYNVMKRIL
jgi:methylenetetrahydrofolate reductase (NADPH)